jgi:hypothetical protein
MVRCERCGSGFSYIRASENEYCPRCKARDGATVPLRADPEATADDSATSEAARSSDGGSGGPVE